MGADSLVNAGGNLSLVSTRQRLCSIASFPVVLQLRDWTGDATHDPTYRIWNICFLRCVLLVEFLLVVVVSAGNETEELGGDGCCVWGSYGHEG